MEEAAGSSPQSNRKSRSFKDLLLLLALIPVILGMLTCCGQLAILLVPSNPPASTGSKLEAEYAAWTYEKIAAIDIEAFLRDVEKENRTPGISTEEETVVVGVFWEPPTPTAVEVAQVSGTPTQHVTPTATALQITLTPMVSRTPMATITRRSTFTALPSITASPTVTRTLPPPPPPPPTNTSAPPPQPATRTPTRTLTQTPVTPVVTTPATHDPETPSPTPTYAPVRPYAENDGVAEPVPGGGCRVFFGYRNDNPQEVDIPVGNRNRMDDPIAIANPPQPTHFLVGRTFRAFEFTWYTGMPLTWWLDERAAVATWCNPPAYP